MVKHKTIGILGLGKSGLAAYKYFLKQGVEIFAFDDNVKLVEKLSQEGIDLIDYKDWNFSKLDFIITSPGIHLYYPQKHYVAIKAEENDVLICADIEIFMKIYQDKKYIAITGTNGKSTTTALIESIFKANNKKILCLGNIGHAVFDIDNDDVDFDFDYVIFELSSYQLSLMYTNKIDCALFLNFEPDHLDYHGSLEAYLQAKSNIFRNQDENCVAIVSESVFKKTEKYLQKQQVLIVDFKRDCNFNDIYISDGVLFDNTFEKNEAILDFNQLLYLKGHHNQQNISFAYACARFFNLDLQIILSVIQSFKGLKHRQEEVRKIDNVVFVNDSKATNQKSVLQALKIMKNVYLILGGKAKEDNLNDILSELTKVRGIFLIGSSKELYSQILSENNIGYEIMDNLESAVKKAYSLAKEEQNQSVVLLSPACSSFDEFESFEHRGENFIQIVNSLV